MLRTLLKPSAARGAWRRGGLFTTTDVHEPMSTSKHFDAKDIDSRLAYQLLVGTVVPRPIAWISTLSENGVSNLAPYSFFTVASTYPPVLSVTQVNPRVGADKDTLANLRQTKECQVNLVTHDLVEVMNGSCANYPRDVSEFEALGIESVAGTRVMAPGVAKSLVRMECTLRDIVSIGNSSVMYLDVVHFVVSDAVTRDGRIVDDALFVGVGKLGGDGYASVVDRFELARPQL